MKFQRDSTVDEYSLDINITSLIDIVLCLLFFFMVSASFIGSTGIDVNLPRASGKAVEQSDAPLTVVITKNGAMHVGEKKVSLDTVKTLATQLKQKTPQATIVVRADTDTSHGMVVAVLDVAKDAGIERIAIATVPGKKE